MAQKKVNEVVDLRCKLLDVLKCTDCNRISTVKNLIAVLGEKIPKPGEQGYWQQIWYYCPCNDKAVKVYDPGDGALVVVYLAHVVLWKEFIKS